MASVMAIGSEVPGRCVEEIEISVGVDYEGRWLCCGWIFEVYLGVKSVSKSELEVGEMVPGIGWLLGTLEVIEEIKNPCRSRGFAW